MCNVKNNVHVSIRFSVICKLYPLGCDVISTTNKRKYKKKNVLKSTKKKKIKESEKNWGEERRGERSEGVDISQVTSSTKREGFALFLSSSADARLRTARPRLWGGILVHKYPQV